MSPEKPADLAVVAANLRKLLEALRTGEMTAPAGTFAQIKGVILALDSVDVVPKSN